VFGSGIDDRLRYIVATPPDGARAADTECEHVDADIDFASIDVETADEHADSICCIGIVLVARHAIVRRALRVVRPPRPVKDVHARIHGITDELVDAAANFSAVWREVSPWLAGVTALLAHNAAFERRVLGAASSAISAEMHGNWVCTLKLARETWEIDTYGLDAVCRYLGIKITHHNALSDAEASMRVFLAAGSRSDDRV
jgi:DNA polymerase III subunit epsilon